MKLNQNNPIDINLKSNVLFVDMNSFFASCEQQTNYWLRNRPIGVCVYTGKYGAVIALSKEAKKMGIKPARVDEIMKICPQFVPLETNPARYREFHVKIMKVLQQFSEDVVPKSIDEAVVNFAGYHLLYKDMLQVARDIKKKIYQDVGDWLTCSIGVAPNAFLAKLGTEIQKPDGLVLISPDNIDSILEKLALTDLPGISKGIAWRLVSAGINSPLQVRHTPPEVLRRACHSIVGEYWHYRLNFREVDIVTDNYKSMQAMRQVSKAQRASLETIYDILRALCLQLERRLVKHQLAAHFISLNISYEEHIGWTDKVRTNIAIQDGIEIMNVVLSRVKKYEMEHECPPLINKEITSLGVYVTEFKDSELIQLNIFGGNLEKDNLRKVVYSIKNKFGFEKILHAAEIQDTPVLKDVIGFGSIKDLI